MTALADAPPDRPLASKDVVYEPSDYFREASLKEIFPDPARPLEVDLGCGDGLFLEQMAAMHPERNFLGVERLVGRVDKTARRIAKRGLPHVRVLRLETSYTLRWHLPPGCVSRLHLLCPDPWPKAAHRRNRIVNQAEFIDGLQRVLAPGAEFLVKSDDLDFFENAVEVLSALPTFRKLDWPEDAFPYPRTTFEEQWLALGKVINRARWQWMA